MLPVASSQSNSAERTSQSTDKVPSIGARRFCLHWSVPHWASKQDWANTTRKQTVPDGEPSSCRCPWSGFVGDRGRIITHKPESGITLTLEPKLGCDEGDAAVPCYGGDGGELNSPSRRDPTWLCYRLVRHLLSYSGGAPPAGFPPLPAESLRPCASASAGQHPDLKSPAPHPRR